MKDENRFLFKATIPLINRAMGEVITYPCMKKAAEEYNKRTNRNITFNFQPDKIAGTVELCTATPNELEITGAIVDPKFKVMIEQAHASKYEIAGRILKETWITYKWYQRLWHWVCRKKMPHRTIEDFELMDVSLVTQVPYADIPIVREYKNDRP